MQARAQLDGGNKKLAELGKQLEALEKLLAAAEAEAALPALPGGNPAEATVPSTPTVTSADHQAEVDAIRASIRKEIDKETQKKAGLEKLVARLSGQQAAEAKRQLQECEHKISSLTSELGQETITGSGVPQVRETVEFNEHRFRMTSYTVPMECQVCFQSLKLHQNAQNEGFSCQACHLVCHKKCHITVSEACSTVHALKDVAPTFFQTDNEEHKLMWLTQLQLIRSTSSQ